MSTDTQNGGQAATDGFGAVRSQAESLVQKGVEAVNQGAAQVQQTVQSTAQSYVDQAKSAAAGELKGVADFVRNAVPADKAPPLVSQYVNQAADGIEQFAKGIQDQDLQSILSSVNDFARRQPGLFLGASVAVGFVVARFLRSSGGQRVASGRYGAPVGSLYPPQDFAHGHGTRVGPAAVSEGNKGGSRKGSGRPAGSTQGGGPASPPVH